jgi:UDP-glucose 4-epimerase
MTLSIVTGGCGFIGSNLSLELAARGHDVLAIDNLLTGRTENIAAGQKGVKVAIGDIRDLAFLKREFSGADNVFHQAALPSVPRSVADPAASNDNNVNGTLNVLIAARDCGIKRVVFASSSSVYGDTPTLPKREDMMPNPLSPYAVSKLSGEYYCKVFHKIYGLETVILRYFNVFGPRQDPTSHYAAVIPKFITSMMKGAPPVIFGDGLQTRDFTFVQNVVEANILASTAPKKAVAESINIACSERITLNALVEKLNRILKKDISPTYAKERPGDIKHSYADIAKAKELLGYSPKYTFQQGIKKTAEWFIK